MFETRDLRNMEERNGADSRELNVFCYFAFYPYFNA